MGVEVVEINPCEASPEAQEAAAPGLGSLLDPSAFDAVVVDALARIVCSPHLDRWRGERPVAAMVHELPSVAAADDSPSREHEEPLLRSDRLISVSAHGASILEERGVPAADRKSTRLNSSHANISYAVFCLKKKNTLHNLPRYSIPSST